MRFERALPIVALLVCSLLGIACASQTSAPKPSSPLKPVTLPSGTKLQVVATTSIIADMAANVGGDLIELRTLLPIGTDPHTFEPTPREIQRTLKALEGQGRVRAVEAEKTGAVWASCRALDAGTG